MDGPTTSLTRDFADLLSAFISHDVQFLLVGAYAVAVHGHPRGTGDLDLWIDCTPENASKTYAALAAFGAPLGDVTAGDLACPGIVVQVGVAPLRAVSPVSRFTTASSVSFR